MNHEPVAGTEYRGTVELLKRARAGDPGAEEQLIRDNLALVHSVAKRFRDRGADYEDLFQIGCVGFVKAIKNFDMNYNVCFSTYAVPMIAGEIKRFLRDDGIIKVSRSLREKSFEIFSTKERLKDELKREPTIEELAQRLEMCAEDIVFAIEAVRSPVSIYEPAFDDESSKTLLIDTMSEDTSSDMIDKLLLKELIGHLDPKERQLIMLRYYSDKTQMEIAEILGVSQVQVSRLITKIINKLKSAAE
jgi:RNA polymerase sporulation-specific sigma factor